MDDKGMIHHFGYTEMYEWKEYPKMNNSQFGLFVGMTPDAPNKIVPFNKKCAFVGITTICSASVSDDPEEWFNKNLYNEYGDMYVKTERLAVGEKKYDQNEEISYIQTRQWEHYIQIENPNYNKDAKYIRRSNRNEWIRVNLLGKVILQDDGTVKPGEYCTPYIGNVKARHGTAVPAKDTDTLKFLVLDRVSKNTILVLNK